MKVDGCPHASEVCSYAELERQTHNALQYSRAFNAVAGVVAAYGTAEDPRAYAEKVAHRLCPNMLPYTIGTGPPSALPSRTVVP